MIDNEGCDPSSWNNHGSVIKVGDDWYVFYHASSNDSAFSRRARAERLQVDESAAQITQGVPSTNGFVKTLRPEHIVSPVNACRFFGGAFVTETDDGRFPCVGLKKGAGFVFSPVLFERGSYSLTVTHKGPQPVFAAVRIDDLPAASAQLPASDDWSDTQFVFSSDEGFHSLIIEISDSDGSDSCAIDKLKIQKQ